jgi:hypothetical protein
MNLNGSIQLPYKTLQEWTSLNPILKMGQVAVVVFPEEKVNVKYGDGVKRFLQLPYAGSISEEFGAWTDVPFKSAFIVNEALDFQYKADLLTTADKSTIYIAGQFDLSPDFTGTEITLGIMPVFCRPVNQLKRWFASQATEMFWVLEPTGELKIVSKDGFNLPVVDDQLSQPYFLNLFFKVPTLFTATRTGSFSRLSCDENEVGSIVHFSKTYLAFSLYDAQVLSLQDPDFDQQGQQYANDPINGGVCVFNPPPVEYRFTRSAPFTNINCGPGGIGSAVTFSKEYTSLLSEADAKFTAENDPEFPVLGQAFANDPANGATCTYIPEIITYTKKRTGEFSRNNCGPDMKGSAVSFSKTYYSTVSQADADRKAANDTINFNALGQQFANDPANGATCTLERYYIWGKISEENLQTITGAWYADIMLRTYKGYSATVPPQTSPGNEIACTAIDIRLNYRTEGTYPAGPNNYAVNLNNSKSTRLVAPNTQRFNPVYPKQIISLPDGTYFYVAFDGKARNEMILLQTIN